MEPQTLTANPLHIMDDEELVSSLCLAYPEMLSNATPVSEDEFKDLRRELMYRLRKSHIESWTPPARTAPK